MQVKHSELLPEASAIPATWSVKTIGNLLEDGSITGHLDGNHGELYPRSNEFKLFGVPYVGANDFENGSVVFERCKFLSPERAKKFRKGVARDGDVLFAHNATVGPVALLRTPEPIIVLSTTATYFRCNPERLDNLFLRFALESIHFVGQYKAVMAQSTRFQVPITAQRKLSLVVPPLPEQRAIAEALTDVDALVDALDRLIAKKRDLKQAAMQQLLTGRTRLPGFAGQWEVKRLGNMSRFFPGTYLAQNAYRDGRYLVQGAGSIMGHHDTANFSEAISVIGRVGTVGRPRFMPAGCWVNNNAGTIAADASRSTPEFIHLVLLTVDWSKATSVTAQPFLVVPSLLDMPFAFPVRSEQAAIAAVLWDMEDELKALEKQRSKTVALKQGMMQELLTGRTRLV